MKVKCYCGRCEYGNRVRALMKRQRSESDRNLVEDLMERMSEAQADAEIWRLKAHGQWPTSMKPSRKRK